MDTKEAAFFEEVDDDDMFKVTDMSIKRDGWSWFDIEIIDHDTRGASEVLTMWAHSHGLKVCGMEINDDGNIETTIHGK